MTRRIASGKKATDIVFFEKRFEIPDYDNPAGEPARIRWRIVHTPWFGVYLHKWLKPDPRPTIHNHPWPFLSIVLRGGYIEATENDHRIVNLFNWTPKRKFHTVVSLLKVPTWTLMLVGPTGSNWGYKDENGKYVEFDKHPHSAEFGAALKARRKALHGN